MFLKFCLGTHGPFEEFSRHTNMSGSQECPNCRVCKGLAEKFLSLLCMISRAKIFRLLEASRFFQMDIFEAFLHSSVFDKAQYNRVDDFLMSFWDRRKDKWHTKPIVWQFCVIHCSSFASVSFVIVLSVLPATSLSLSYMYS